MKTATEYAQQITDIRRDACRDPGREQRLHDAMQVIESHLDDDLTRGYPLGTSECHIPVRGLSAGHRDALEQGIRTEMTRAGFDHCHFTICFDHMPETFRCRTTIPLMLLPVRNINEMQMQITFPGNFENAFGDLLG